jgi:hypothetical protein
VKSSDNIKETNALEHLYRNGTQEYLIGVPEIFKMSEKSSLKQINKNTLRKK